MTKLRCETTHKPCDLFPDAGLTRTKCSAGISPNTRSTNTSLDLYALLAEQSASWSHGVGVLIAQGRLTQKFAQRQRGLRPLGYKSSWKHMEYTRAGIEKTKAAHPIMQVRFSLCFTPSQDAALYTHAPAALPFQHIEIPLSVHCIRYRPARRDRQRLTRRSCRCLLRSCRME